MFPHAHPSLSAFSISREMLVIYYSKFELGHTFKKAWFKLRILIAVAVNTTH